MEPNKKKSKNQFYDFFKLSRSELIFNLFFSLIWLIIGASLIAISPAHLYGVYLGIVGLWFSIGLFIFFSYLIERFIKGSKKKIWLTIGSFVLIRFSIFAIIFAFAIIKDLNFKNNSNNIDLILEPINIIFLIFSYQIFGYSIIFAQIFDNLIINKKNKNKRKEK